MPLAAGVGWVALQFAGRRTAKMIGGAAALEGGVAAGDVGGEDGACADADGDDAGGVAAVGVLLPHAASVPAMARPASPAVTAEIRALNMCLTSLSPRPLHALGR